MSIYGNPVMLGGSGGSNIYLLDGSKITAYLTALGQTQVTMFTGKNKGIPTLQSDTYSKRNHEQLYT